MSCKLIFIAFLAIYSVSSISGHQIFKRQTLESNDGLVSATNQWTQFFSNALNTLNTLNTTFTGNAAQNRINQINGNLSNWRNSLTDASGDIAQDLMVHLRNVSHRLNTVLRERANNDRNLAHRLYGMIYNMTRNGTNNSMETLRRAFTTATKTMAENFSHLANSSLVLASDMRDKGSLLFNNARIRAGNDTNRAVIAVNTALNAIRNSSQPINETVQQMAVNLTKRVQNLSSQLRNLMNQSPTDSTADDVISPEFRQKAEQSLQKVMSNMNQLRDSLGQFSTNVITDDNNVADNEIDVIQKTSKLLSKESEDLQNQINSLRG